MFLLAIVSRLSLHRDLDEYGSVTLRKRFESFDHYKKARILECVPE